MRPSAGFSVLPAGERVAVPVVMRSAAPPEWQPTLRLLDQLAEMFPDAVLDVSEVPHLEEEQWLEQT